MEGGREGVRAWWARARLPRRGSGLVGSPTRKPLRESERRGRERASERCRMYRISLPPPHYCSKLMSVAIMDERMAASGKCDVGSYRPEEAIEKASSLNFDPSSLLTFSRLISL